MIALLAGVLSGGCGGDTPPVSQEKAPEPKFFVGFADDAFKFEPAAALPTARDLGATAFRITLGWQPGQTEVLTEDRALLDQAAEVTQGNRLVVSVYGANEDAPLDATAREEYCAYVHDLLEDSPAIRDVVIWNEPNKGFFWQPQYEADGSSAAPGAYAALLVDCWSLLHDLDPDVNVIAPATAPTGKDDPDAESNISHAPGTFIRELGEAYRASGSDAPIFDTVGHHAYGKSPGEPPSTDHSDSTISLGDYPDLLQALEEAFGDTAQPVPGECVEDRCTSIWYLEMGFEAIVDPSKRAAYTGAENIEAIPDVADGSGEPLRDQATQIRESVRIASCQPYVGAYFNFLLWDEGRLEGWQSGAMWADRTPKDSYAAFKEVIDEVRAGSVDC